ncbi:MAG: hypothetical protein HOO93_15465 [Methyloglobulus sp.]|nr:hypothetical protein [Methyloglobulus sp.]
MDIPESMKAELSAWNNGTGIDLELWIGCEGTFSLAVGYSTVFWPEFVEFESYILSLGFSETSLREFESQQGSTRKSVEWVMNHLHIADIQYYGCKDISKDKIIPLGNVLKQIYEAKLKWQFPDRPCIVEFYVPKNEDELTDYQISFWQKQHE